MKIRTFFIFIIAALALITSAAFAQAPPQQAPPQVPAKYDTIPPIELNKLQQARVDDIEIRKQKALGELSRTFVIENAKVMEDILEANNINPNHIDGDSLKVNFSPGKILLYRKQKDVKAAPTKKKKN